MQQLSGMDAAFVYLETPGMPMHIGSLAIYDQSTAPGGKVGFKDILEYFGNRVHKARCFRQKLARVPLELDHPFWIEDPDFDLEFHVRHIALPQPGDWRQLCIQAARLHSRPLDISKPLWEFYIIEGLNNLPGVPEGAFALVSKVHHAAIDGVSGAEMAAAIHDLTPDTEIEPPDTVWSPDHTPTGVELLTRSALSTLKKPFRFAKMAANTLPSVGRIAGAWSRKELDLRLQAPRTRFNTNVSPHRVFDGRKFPLDEVKAIKSAVEGATVNDAIVAVAGGALRKYLESKSELPKESMIAMAPISARPEAQRHAAGNLVSAMSLPIRSDIEDPVSRLRAVRDESREAKKLSATLGLSLGNDAAEFLPSPVANLLARAYGRARMADRLPPIFNTIITNVPGAQVPLYSMGAQLVANFGLGPIAHGVGLFQPVLSYNGTITVSAVSCREMMPDPAFYCECLQASYDEMKLATVGASKTVSAPAAEKTAAKTKKKRASKKRPGKPAAPLH